MQIRIARWTSQTQAMLVGVAVVSCFTLVLPTASAQDLARVLPREDGVPAWLKEGERLTYYSAVASVPRSMYYWSPNENGNWESGDGKRWDRFNQPGAAGHGHTQVDVVAVEPPRVALSVRAWHYYVLGGPLVPGNRSSLIAAPVGGDWWVHPDVLQRVPGVLRIDPNTLEQFKIVRMNMKMIPTKQVFGVVRFQYERDGARHTVAYDAQTGILVFNASMAEAPAHLWTKGNTLLSEMWLVDRRSVKVPWANANMPDQFRPGARMRYEGTAKVETASPSPLMLSLTADLTIADRGKRWVQYDQTTQMGSLPGMPAAMPEKATLVAASHQFGGLWIPPDALQQLRAGEILDTDRITNEEIRVRQILAEGGRNVMVFTATSRAARADAIYDMRTGYLLRGSTSQVASELVRQSAELRLTRGPD